MTKHFDSGAHVAELMAVDKSTLPADGGERFNRLIFARSPYLLQHAENPVDWYEWGDEAFAKARSENLPVLLSIGYATCHWCHVMAHESFGDEEVAQLLNRDYVCIKVDREERPDIDDFYMTVSQVLTGSGGWPLNIFMTPDKRPFFAMTYLPKRGRQGMSGFMDLLGNISTLWHDHPERIEKNCAGIMEALGHLASAEQEELTDLEEISRTAMKQLTGSYDREYGGFGSAPKFPMPINLEWLIDQGVRGQREGMALALQTLRSIREGGIWDQFGGGIHRYSVDREWLVPHFEKMLYDQAMVARAAGEAFQATGDLFYREMVLNIFDFVHRELTSADGGFFCALDADSEGVEGKYYVWDKREIVALLGPEAELFCSFYDITDRGNFEGHSIPNIPVPLEEFCHQEGLDLRETGKILEQCRRRILERREQRVRPLRDEKIITAWNGLMIASLARGGAILNQPEAVQSAARAAEFILGELRRPDGRLLRSHLNGPSPVPGFLEDYAFLCHGLIELYEATLDPIWQSRALDLTEEMIRLFHDPDSQRFFKIGKDAEQMPVQASLEHDGVMPSSFSLASRCFVRLGHTLERPEMLDLAYGVLSGLQSDARRHPTAYLGCLQSWDLLENEPVLVTLHGDRHAPLFRELLMAAHSLPVPRLMLRHGILDGETRAELCAEGACRPPVTSPSQLRRQLEELQGVKG